MDVSNLGLLLHHHRPAERRQRLRQVQINVKLNEELSSSKTTAALQGHGVGAVAGLVDCTATVQQYGMTDDLTSQLSTGLTIKIYGTDAETLTALSEKVVDIVNNTEGFQNAGQRAWARAIPPSSCRWTAIVRANGLTVAGTSRSRQS